MWERFCRLYFEDDALGLSIDVSRVREADQYLADLDAPMQTAFKNMRKIEEGAIANISEKRMVGHYWLRNPEKVPTEKIGNDIRETIADIRKFAAKVHKGTIKDTGGKFKNLLHVGIGGSALGPQLVADALGSADDKMKVYFADNTDPDGLDRVLGQLRDELDRTLVTVVSKSGTTAETRNGMLEAQEVFRREGIPFNEHAVAITLFDMMKDKETGEETRVSKLYAEAIEDKWLKKFAIWDWVGGRTSVTSAVGLVPAALQGIDIDGILAGAAAMDELTRSPKIEKNPAALLAAMWYGIGEGQGKKDMVILPYKDRLMLFAKYLQQLVMESLGKESDRQGNKVQQGIAVYGNKGSTDQHAYVQQLRDGVPNFFATFVQVLSDRKSDSIVVDDKLNATSGDYLCGFLRGTRAALYEKERDSITITVNELTPQTLGALIALYERAVGLYAELVNIDAYDQPGVQAGKLAAGEFLTLQNKAVTYLQNNPGAKTPGEIAKAIDEEAKVESVFHVLQHLAVNEDRKIKLTRAGSPSECRFEAV